MKKIICISYVLVIVVLAAATIVEKIYGTPWVGTYIYGSWWFAMLWGILAVCAAAFIWRNNLRRRPVAFCIHAALILILAGALTTHIFGIQGSIHLRTDKAEAIFTDKDDNSNRTLPFSVSLKEFTVENYVGTLSPMDYVSQISFSDNNETASVSMNKIVEHRGYRFYQSGYDDDMKGSYLSISYDPWGIGITYTGYFLLFLSLILMLILPKEGFRTALRRISQTSLTLLLLILAPTNASAKTDAQLPKTLSAEQAEQMANLYAYYNGRICPLQTVAHDFTVKLYGKASYRGLSSAQVLTGWMLYPTDWMTEKMIKVKGDVANTLSNEDKFVSFAQIAHCPQWDEKLKNGGRNFNEANEKYTIARILLNGKLVKLFPFQDDEKNTVWFSSGDRLPVEKMPEGQMSFIRNGLSLLAEMINNGETENATTLISKIRTYQQKTVGASLPDDAHFQAEKLYYSLSITRPLAMALTTLGILSFILFMVLFGKGRSINKAVKISLIVIVSLSALYMVLMFCLRWFVSGHVPLSNGFETMQFLSLTAMLLTLFLCRKFVLILPFGILLAGLSLMVSMFGESTPQITNLIPVLTSPLLSLHVCAVMIAYSLLAFGALNGITALILHSRTDALANISRAILYPAIACLAIGIFIGAIWANQSWGRYWGWDPKEVWALITMMVYALPFHPSLLPQLQNSRALHIFMIAAFLTVLMTYFGVNFLLGGLHSYANS